MSAGAIVAFVKGHFTVTGKRYYMTTLGAWRRHAGRFANSHFIVVDAPPVCLEGPASARNVQEEAGNCGEARELPDSTPIIALIEADEGAHLALEDEPAFDALPHPLAQKPISDTAQSALASHGVLPGATTFEAAEAVARAHPLLRHHVF